MTESRRLEFDREIGGFYDTVIKRAIETLEHDHLGLPGDYRKWIRSDEVEISIQQSPISDKKNFRYALYVEENKLLSACSFTKMEGKGRESYINPISDNYQDATVDDIVDDFLIQYRGWPRGPIGEPPTD